jgi:hypothetical protein
VRSIERDLTDILSELVASSRRPGLAGLEGVGVVVNAVGCNETSLAGTEI